MNTLDWLSDPVTRPILLSATLTGLAIALMCAVLSPLVVLKRLSFVGQGISHAAFGGIGIAAMIAVLVGTSVPLVGSAHFQFGVVLVFCLLSAVMVGWLTDRGSRQADTAIGIVLVGSMALGAMLIQLAMERGQRQVGWESILFGDVLSVNWADAQLAWLVAGAIVVVVWALRRRMLFWAFDEAAAPAFGVPGSAMKYVLITLLAVAIVTAMKLAGVVLATALLVLPAASALRLSDRYARVVVISAGVAVAGVVCGLVLSFESNLPPGACIVAVLVAVFAAARLGGRSLAGSA